MVTIVGLRRSIGVRSASRIRPTNNRIAARLRESPAALTITLATGGWNWTALAQSVTRTVSSALLLAGVVALLRTPRVQHQPRGAVNQPANRAQVSTDELIRELSDITDIAGELGLIPNAGRRDESWDDAFEYLDSIRWSLANYLLRGDRTRRLMNAPNLLVEIGSSDDDGLSRAASALCSRADELAGQVRYTNTVVSDWLVAHRVAVANPCYLDSNALFDRCRCGEFDPMSIAEDPLYLLICHLHDILEVVEDSGEVEVPALEHLKAKLTLPLRAVQHEIAAAMAYSTAALGVTRAVAKMQAN
jgi:hypothetical protein